METSPTSPVSRGWAGELPVDSAEALAAFVVSRRRQDREALRQVEVALAFCSFNSPDSRGPAATLPGTEGELTLAGDGAPQVAEFAVIEFAAVAAMSTDAGRAYLARCLELGHRLPRTWHRVHDGQIPAWRALRIAEHTIGLPREGAAWVDEQIAPIAGRVGTTVLDRLIQRAIVMFDPEAAEHARLEAAATRHATLTLEHAFTDLGTAGPTTVLALGRLDAVLDTADALDLDTALADLAADLAAAGDPDPLGVRRAKALGLLARGEAVTLPQAAVPPRRRQVVLHIHLSQAALHGLAEPGHPDGGIGSLHGPTGHPLGPVTVEQVQEWCGTRNAHITVRPVLDLTEDITCTGYQPSPRLRDQTTARHQVCVFPYCTRPAQTCDLDHIDPWHAGGTTTSNNLAPLCRRHHRTKTHAGWTYHPLTPTEHLWTSPHHHHWITDPHGTHPIPAVPTTTAPSTTAPSTTAPSSTGPP